MGTTIGVVKGWTSEIAEAVVHPEEFDRMFLRRGARTRAEEAAGLRRARRLGGWAAALFLGPLLWSVVWILLLYFWIGPALQRALNG